MFQAKKLGIHLSTRYRFTHLFSSDLQRAYKTAMAIQQAQQEEHNVALPLYQLKVLQEQDFGTFERMTFAARAKVVGDNTDGVQQPETKGAMILRANEFLDDHLLPLLFSEAADETLEVALVSHGLILSTIWRCLLRRFTSSTVDVAWALEIPTKDMLSLEHLGAWSNTGYLELEIALIDPHPDILFEAQNYTVPEPVASSELTPPLASRYKMTILVVNNKEHLQGLKRTGGGVGSSKHDDKQKSIESFFKKRSTG